MIPAAIEKPAKESASDEKISTPTVRAAHPNFERRLRPLFIFSTEREPASFLGISHTTPRINNLIVTFMKYKVNKIQIVFIMIIYLKLAIYCDFVIALTNFYTQSFSYVSRLTFIYKVFFMSPTWFPKNYYDNVPQGKKVAYINARIIDPDSGLDINGQLLTDGRNIADIGESLFGSNVPDSVEVVDCNGKILMPGIVDIQVHFRDPGQEHKETLVTGSKSAVAGGITAVVCQPNTSPVIDSELVLDCIKHRANEAYIDNIFCYGAVTAELAGKEMTQLMSLKEKGVVGFTDDGLPVTNSFIMRQALEYSKVLQVPIAQHAEDLSLSNGGCMNEGIVSDELGVRGMPAISESIMVARDLQLLEVFGGYYHVLHVSAKESVELIRRAKEKGLQVTAEAAPHHFTLTDEAVRDYNTLAKMNPPLKSESDRLAIIQGIKDGTIDCIATDHAPHEPEAKDTSLQEAAFGIVGLETMLPLSLDMHFKEGVDLKKVLGMLTCKPADVIMRKDVGRLRKGAVADMSLIDIDYEWVVDPEKFASKSKNSPFGGRKVRGKNLMTVVGGKIVYKL